MLLKNFSYDFLLTRKILEYTRETFEKKNLSKNYFPTLHLCTTSRKQNGSS